MTEHWDLFGGDVDTFAEFARARWPHIAANNDPLCSLAVDGAIEQARAHSGGFFGTLPQILDRVEAALAQRAVESEDAAAWVRQRDREEFMRRRGLAPS